jgi:hypothetical protein
MRGKNNRIGAFGEKAVEAELLRHGWLPANVNSTVKNADDFDIFALKDGRTVRLRIKACSPGMNAFQFGGFQPGQPVEFKSLSKSDFTILVNMGRIRGEDSFYVIPTKIIRKQIDSYRTFYLNTAKRDGHARKDIGHWTLRLSPLKSGDNRPNYNLVQSWTPYLNNWMILEQNAE